MKNWK